MNYDTLDVVVGADDGLVEYNICFMIQRTDSGVPAVAFAKPIKSLVMRVKWDEAGI